MKSFFADDEMKCPCCGRRAMNLEFMDKLNLARYLAGFPFVINSGYRCENNNAAVGSTSDNHPFGRAADIRCTDQRKRYEMVKALIGTGMLGIGIGPKFVHCDTNRTTPRIRIY